MKTVLQESILVIAWALPKHTDVGLERFAPKSPMPGDAHLARCRDRLCTMHRHDPGVSRSGATIGGLLLTGPARHGISFFLAMPTMVAAFIYDFIEVKDHITPTVSLRSPSALCLPSFPR